MLLFEQIWLSQSSILISSQDEQHLGRKLFIEWSKSGATITVCILVSGLRPGSPPPGSKRGTSFVKMSGMLVLLRDVTTDFGPSSLLLAVKVSFNVALDRRNNNITMPVHFTVVAFRDQTKLEPVSQDWSQLIIGGLVQSEWRVADWAHSQPTPLFCAKIEIQLSFFYPKNSTWRRNQTRLWWSRETV